MLFKYIILDYVINRPYSRQVIERMGCNVVIHPPPSIYPKAGNGALRDQWAIKYNCQNDSSTIAFTVRDLVHWNYIISQNIPRVCKSWKSLSIYVFAAYIILFTRHSVHWSKLPVKLRSGRRQWPPKNNTEGNCNYRNPNMDVGKLNSAGSGHLNNVNRMVE